MQKILTHKRYYENKIESISNWEVSEAEKKNIRKFIQDYETGKITNRVGTNIRALIERLLDYLKICLESINKDNPSKKDIETFFDDLLKDKICKSLKSKGYNREIKFKKKINEPYALKTKQSIYFTLEKYLKWKFPNKPELLLPLKIRINSKKPEPKYLTESEIDQLRLNAGDVENRATISILYSSGARAEEFYNIRYSDVYFPKGEESFIKLRLRNEYSKTEGRTISLYYKYALEDLRELFEKLRQQGVKPEEPIFQKKYRAQRDWLSKLGKKVLSKPINFHLFRHSSATKNASKMNRQQLCIFYGWKFNSNMPDVYIKRDGVDMQELDKQMQGTELEALKNQLSKTEYERKLQNEKIEELKANIFLQNKINNAIIENLTSSKPALSEKAILLFKDLTNLAQDVS